MPRVGPMPRLASPQEDVERHLLCLDGVHFLFLFFYCWVFFSPEAPGRIPFVVAHPRLSEVPQVKAMSSMWAQTELSLKLFGVVLMDF